MHTSLVIFPTDILLWLTISCFIIFFLFARKKAHWQRAFTRFKQRPTALIASSILLGFVIIGLLDSIHLQVNSVNHGSEYVPLQTISMLDKLLTPIGHVREKTYSAPFASHLYVRQTVESGEQQVARAYLPLEYATNSKIVIWEHFVYGLLKGIFTGSLVFLIAWLLEKFQQEKLFSPERKIFLTSFSILLCIWFVAINVATVTHIFGTGKIGQDIFYEALKSVRTGIIIGTLTTIFMIPFAILFGMMAGYLGGWVDDMIQYFYITLSSIPGVLLIAASILALQVYIANHEVLFPNLAVRADIRLLALCIILGITSWTSLCRLIRAETLKIRELDYIAAAQVLGVNTWRILFRHILPNVMHIILITVALDFSSLVLAEAVLSYVGVGVDPTTFSFGNMINSARLELAREPIVWWPLASAFIMMLLMVLSANIVAEHLRAALDPRSGEG